MSYMLISYGIVILAIIPFFRRYEKRKPKAREIVLIAMYTAITVAAQIFFHVTVPIQIETTLTMIAGISMGPEVGFLIGALARLIANFYMGQGPWTPWQMFTYGLVGFLAGLAFNKAKAENLWVNGKPKKWYYAIPFVAFWVIIFLLIILAICRNVRK